MISTCHLPIYPTNSQTHLILYIDACPSIQEQCYHFQEVRPSVVGIVSRLYSPMKQSSSYLQYKLSNSGAKALSSNNRHLKDMYKYHGSPTISTCETTFSLSRSSAICSIVEIFSLSGSLGNSKQLCTLVYMLCSDESDDESESAK